ncbi:hypothetical protein [Flyfo podovirus Tbat2_2]|nr:hypothetical protein [Flyfo podovirus Tbat2_2]
MKYTIVWNENKTEGIILSGEDRLKDAEHAAWIDDHLGRGVSTLADSFRDVYDFQHCTIQDGLVPVQPTDEMIKAGMDAYFQSYHDSGDTVEDMVKFIWRAMVQEMNK